MEWIRVVRRGMLTDHLKVDKETSRWLRPNLTLVETRIALLGELQLQRPIARVPLMVHREALVVGVRESTRRQNVQVPVTYPRHLHIPQLFTLLDASTRPSQPSLHLFQPQSSTCAGTGTSC